MLCKRDFTVSVGLAIRTKFTNQLVIIVRRQIMFIPTLKISSAMLLLLSEPVTESVRWSTN